MANSTKYESKRLCQMETSLNKYNSPKVEIFEIALENGILMSVFGEEGAAGNALKYIENGEWE